MRSIQGVQATPGVGGEIVDRNHGLRRDPTPVWVLLDQLVQRPPGQPEHRNAAGLDMTGRARGLLSRWIPTYQGEWCARVSFSVPYIDGRRQPEFFQDQIVPAYALRRLDPHQDDSEASTGA